ncbi:MAG: hypothetical protein ACLQJR_35400 [Stellaceae bacterium]
MATVPGAKTPATWHVACVLFAGVAALAGAESARADSYTVLVRQVEGIESVPAHMTCEDGKICRGEMSVSVEGGHRRIFVRGMIYGPNAYFKFRSDTRALNCGDVEFITFQIGRPPVSAHEEVGICDRRSAAQHDGSGLRHPVLTSFPPFAILRIDVRLRSGANGG